MNDDTTTANDIDLNASHIRVTFEYGAMEITEGEEAGKFIGIIDLSDGTTHFLRNQSFPIKEDAELHALEAGTLLVFQRNKNTLLNMAWGSDDGETPADS